jgi:hypothetical protein
MEDASAEVTDSAVAEMLKLKTSARTKRIATDFFISVSS